MKHNEFKPGQTVWVCHFTQHAYKAPSAKLSEREFYHYSHYSNPSWAKGELRAVVGPIGKAKWEGTSAPYGTAYKPESVFANRELARLELARRMNAAIDALATLRNEVCKP